MIKYTIEIKAMSIVCREGKIKGARKFMRADGIEFYILGKVQHRREIAANIALNKAIEHGYKAVNVKWWDYIK